MTYTSEDFERFYIRYMDEAMPRGVSIQAYCSRNKVPYNLFDKWYSDTRHKVIQVKVAGMPEPDSTPSNTPAEAGETDNAPTPKGNQSGAVRIMIDIRLTNGLHLQQRNLTFDSLSRLVNNLRSLC